MLGEMYGEIIETTLSITLLRGKKTIIVDYPLQTRFLVESNCIEVGKCVQDCIRHVGEYSRAKIVRKQTRTSLQQTRR